MFRAISCNRHPRYVHKPNVIAPLSFRRVARDLNGNLGHSFTLRQLLQHQSGLADYGDLAAYHEAVARGDEPWPVSELLERTDARRLRSEQGGATRISAS
jgi:CubicO group peptidase (beta-lactamase class C family)